MQLQKLKPSIGLKFKEGLHNKGLIIVGYGGNDISVMTTLEEIINKGDLPYGVLWYKWKGEELNSRSKDFMKMAYRKNDWLGIVHIDNFDDFMFRLYLTLNKPHKILDEWNTKEKFYSCI